MSVTFTKLFSSITASTVWCEPDQTRIAWIAMLAMADRKGRVWGSIPGFASIARIPVDAARLAIATFLAPDEDSRTKEFEGRRIEEIDGGWRLLNYEKHRAIQDEESVLESKRRYINGRRAREREQMSTVDKRVESRGLEIQAEEEEEEEEEEEALKHIETTSLVKKPEGFSCPPCPTQEIVDAYRKHLPALPQPNVLNAARKTAISARWREVCVGEKFTREQGLEWFDWFFSDVARSKFLTGRAASSHRRPFRATLDWLMAPTNFAKAVDGNYRETA